MKRLLDLFRAAKPATASLAKERLQIIISHERANLNSPDYLQQMKERIMAVIREYVEVDEDQVKVHLEKDNDCSILELNVTLPEHPKHPPVKKSEPTEKP